MDDVSSVPTFCTLLDTAADNSANNVPTYSAANLKCVCIIAHIRSSAGSSKGNLPSAGSYCNVKATESHNGQLHWQLARFTFTAL